jgi:sec-independent protein translocase protein TatB
MFDFAWSEIGLIGLVAVIALGPKELPAAMRALGKFTRQARRLAGEFQNHVNELVREAELDEVKRSVENVTTTNVGAEIDKMLDPDGQLGAIEDDLAKAEREMHANMSTRAEAQPPAVPQPAALPSVESPAKSGEGAP